MSVNDTRNGFCGTCGENLTWTLDAEGTLTISGTGDLGERETDEITGQIHEINRERGDAWIKTARVIIEKGITGIGDDAFYGWEMTDVSIPDSVTSIGNHAFGSCESLASVVIPDSVTRIGEYAFTDCPELKNMVLNAERLESIGDDAFKGDATLSRYPCDPGPCGGTCGKNLTWTLDAEGTLTISGSGDMENWELGERYDKRFNNGRPILDVDAHYLHCTSRFCKNRAIRRVVIRDGVTSIGDCAFVACRNLREVIIPDSVTSIGASAFEDCRILAEVRLPDSVTSIGASAFEHCRILAEIRLPDSVTRIGDHAFAGCYDLGDVTFPDHLTSIDESVFKGCNKLPDMAYYCGHNTYRGTCGENLTWTLDATGTLTISGTGDMKNRLFVEGCDGLEVIPETQDKWRRAFRWGDNHHGTSMFFNNGKIRHVVVEAGVTSIGDSAFCLCENLREVEIANSVRYIGDHAFFGCSALASLTLPKDLKRIGAFAFYYCSGLTSVILPKGLKRIGTLAFYCCPALTLLTLPKDLKSIGTDVFYACNALTSPILPEGLTRIEDEAFCQFWNLQELIIPAGVTHIGKNAFLGCTQLRSVTIPDSVVSIDASAFDNCGSAYRGHDILYIRCAAGSYADRWAREHHRKVVRI